MRRFLLTILVLTVSLSAFPEYVTPDRKPKQTATLPHQAKPDELPRAPHAQQSIAPIVDPLGRHTRVFTANGTSGSYGIDVSHYQGNIDWKQVAQDGRVGFVYIKATESSGLVDGTYRRNLEGARAAGIPAGVYHFFSPTATVQQQLSNFFSNVDPKEQDLVPIIDVEAPPRGSVSEYVSRLRNFIDGVAERFGCKPIIYTGPHFHQKYLLGSFTDCRFMFARYNQEAPVPAEKVHFILWQFTASGSIKGIRGNVDRSQFMSPFKLRDILYHGK